MKTIPINQFQGYTKATWLRYLKRQKTTVFCISLPKETLEHVHGPDALFQEYMLAACLGNELAAVAEDFMYAVPAVDHPGEFRFLVITDHLKDLAFVLSFLSAGFDENGEATLSLLAYASIMYEGMVDCRSAGCQLLLNVCRQYADHAGWETS